MYLGIIGCLGYRGFGRTASNKDYLLAGRSVNPFVMAMSYGAAFISTSALVGFGGIAGQFGMGLMWLVFMNIAIGIVVAFIFFGPRTRRIGLALDAHTFPEFMGNRFESNYLKVFLAAIIFLFMPLYSSVVLIGGARFLQEVMMIDYGWALAVFALVVAVYVVFGGLKGVMYVDAMMGTVMIAGMLSLLVMCYWKLGGVASAAPGSDRYGAAGRGAFAEGGGARPPGMDRHAEIQFGLVVDAGFEPHARRRHRRPGAAAARGPLHDGQEYARAEPGGRDRFGFHSLHGGCGLHGRRAVERVFLPCRQGDCGRHLRQARD